MRRAVIYCRVSTTDQSCDRQQHDLDAFALAAGYQVIQSFRETASGARVDRAERARVLALAQRRQIDAILVTELSRWGRSTLDLLKSLHQLREWRVSIVTLRGAAFDLSTPEGTMMATVLASIAQFERELTVERIKSGLAAARLRGRQLGRAAGDRPKSDRYQKKILALRDEGRSYRFIARELGLSKNTVMGVINRVEKERATVP